MCTNSWRGMIRCTDLINMTEVEIRDEPASQRIIEAYRFKIQKEGKQILTSTLFLIFWTPILPQSIRVGYLNVKVILYVQSPLCCFNCNKFGHSSKCTKKCANCSGNVHDVSCQAKCQNCGASNASFSRDCPVYKKEAEIQIMAEKRLSYPESKKLTIPRALWFRHLRSEGISTKRAFSRSDVCETMSYLFVTFRYTLSDWYFIHH